MGKVLSVILLYILWLYAHPGFVSAATYYISPSGNDTNNGTEQSTPWKTLSKVSHTNFGAGDKILLQRGGVWREELIITSSGTTNNPITYSTYGTGPNPLIKRQDSFSNWSLYYNSGGKKIWSGSYGSSRPRGLLENGQRRTGIYISSGTAPESVLENEVFAPANSGNSFYYRKDSGQPQNTEVGAREFGILIDTKDNIIIDSIDCEGPGASLRSQARNGPIYIDPNIAQHPNEKSHNIIVRNLQVKLSEGVGIGNGDHDGLTIYGPENVILENVNVHDTQSTAIYHRGTGRISGCSVHDTGLLPYDSGDRGGIGIQGGPIVIEDCNIYNIGRADNAVDFGISIWQSTGSITIQRNYIHDIKCGGIQINSDDGSGADNHLIAYNIIDKYGTTSYGGSTSGKTSAIRIQRVDGVKIYNNIFANGGSNGTTKGVFARYQSLNTKIKNNIFYQNANSDIVVYSDTNANGFEADNNLFNKTSYSRNWEWLGNGYDSLSNWQNAQKQDLQSLTGDPTFMKTTDSGSAWYKLTASSPAINRAENLGLIKDFAGNIVPVGTSPDIGAYEYQGSEPTVDPTAHPTTNPTATKLSLNLLLHGIGKGGDNVNPETTGNASPLHPQRGVTVEVMDAGNQLAAAKQGSVSYDSSAGSFAGIIDLGQISSGAYTVRIKAPQYLRKVVPGILQLQSGKLNTLQTAALTTGDCNSDNSLSLLDYNMILDCYANLGQPKNCADANKKLMADLTDDGAVNQFDYNLFLRELSVQSGQ